MKIALVHDYLTQKGGAERVFELLCKYLPEADVYTSVYDPKQTIELSDRIVKTTVLQQLPGAKKYFRMLAPLYYPAFRALDLQQYDLIISSTSSFAKAVKKKPEAKHICFCHNVTRFLWDTQTYLDQYKDYKNFSNLIRAVFKPMQKQDLKYAQEPDLYIANSTTVAARIREIYQREAMVINYPIDTNKFSFCDQKKDFYLVSSRIISYKRIDIIVEAFNRLGLPLIIIGDGPERANIERRAAKNIKFLGYVSDEKRTQLMSRASGVIVAGLEDYGLVPIEANASGTPVIAYGAGGVLDTQIDGKTGILFKSQTPEAIQAAVLEARTYAWDYQAIRRHAIDNFSEKIFFEQVKHILVERYGETALKALKMEFSFV